MTRNRPNPSTEMSTLGKLLIALTIQGTIFALTRGIVNHGSRHAYAQLTGSWPGDEQPDAG